MAELLTDIILTCPCLLIPRTVTQHVLYLKWFASGELALTEIKNLNWEQASQRHLITCNLGLFELTQRVMCLIRFKAIIRNLKYCICIFKTLRLILVSQILTVFPPDCSGAKSACSPSPAAPVSPPVTDEVAPNKVCWKIATSLSLLSIILFQTRFSFLGHSTIASVWSKDNTIWRGSNSLLHCSQNLYLFIFSSTNECITVSSN